MVSQDYPAVCVHEDGTEHPAPSDVMWDPTVQRWVRMYTQCQWASGRSW